MAGVDHGEVLTKFEEMFGSVVEHEVIKLVLQSCDWETTSASEILLGMIDKNDLPQHVQNALIARSVVDGNSSDVFSSEAYIRKNDTENESGSNSRISNISVPEIDVGNLLDTARPTSLYDDTSDGISGRSVCGSLPTKCTPESNNVTEIESYIGRHDSSSPRTSKTKANHGNSPEFLRPALPLANDERETVDASPLLDISISGTDSGSLSPSNSPLRMPRMLRPNSQLKLGDDPSKWVLAPEFVPNAFRPNSGSNSNGILPIGMSLGLAQAPLPSSSNDKTFREDSKKEKIVKKILMGRRIVVLMRGLPGSGKSTLAKELKGRKGVILSTDDFFYDKFGRYNYIASKIGEAHGWNKHRTLLKLQEGCTPIVIDNTNLQTWEMKPYVKLALQYGYEIEFLEPETSWKYNVKELSKKNSHGVAKSKIAEMLDRFDHNASVEAIIAKIQDMQISSSTDEEGGNSAMPDPTKRDDNDYKETNADDVMLKAANALSRLETPLTSGGDVALDDEDADVIIEGYESDEEQEIVNFPSYQRINVMKDDANYETLQGDFVMHSKGETSAHEMLDENKQEKSLPSNFGETELILTGEELDAEDINDGDIGATESNTSMTEGKCKGESDEERIRLLIEEANIEVDVQSDTEWEDLAQQAVGEQELSNQKFNDLVLSFGTAVKKQLANTSLPETPGEDIHEDSAMYELCNEIEEKVGRSLSSVVVRSNKDEYGNDCCRIDNHSNITDCQNPEDSSSFSILSIPCESLYAGDKFADYVDNSNTEAESAILKNEVEVTPLTSETDGRVVSDDVLITDTDCRNDYRETEKSDLDGNESFYSEDSNECERAIDAEFNSNEHIELTMTDVKIKDSESVESRSELLVSNNSDTGTLREPQSKEFIENVKEREIIEERANISSSSGLESVMAGDSLSSWECVDISKRHSSLNWDSDEEIDSRKKDFSSKPSRNRRNRSSGDPTKWLQEMETKSEVIDDPAIIAWVPQNDCAASWNPNLMTERQTTASSISQEMKEDVERQSFHGPQPHTGAVSKLWKSQKSSQDISIDQDHQEDRVTSDTELVGIVSGSKNSKNSSAIEGVTTSDEETQTLSIDFEALQLDNNLYELKVLYGHSNYIPEMHDNRIPENGPLTKGKLKLEKGTMTDSASDIVLVEPLQNLIAFFPNISEEDLRDVLEKCKFDLDWAMNVLLDSGYEMSDPSDVNVTQDADQEEMDIDTESHIETNSTSDSKDDSREKTFVDYSDMSLELPEEKVVRKFKQSSEPNVLADKKEIEGTFSFAESVDDRVIRLTGKEYSDLNISKVKHTKGKKKHSVKKNSDSKKSKKKDGSLNNEDFEAAQYITLVMDPLFSSQLMSLFGPVGACGLNGDLMHEDRSVILPLDLCYQIHKFWANTVDGKFHHEAEVLDSMIREDENLARRLQEEENSGSKSGVDDGNLGRSDEAFQVDPPTNLREIMDLEQALQESQEGHLGPVGDPSLSARLNLRRLYAEYPHVDMDALKEEFVRSRYNYQDTVEQLYSRYGSEEGAPRTVIAPEAMYRYEQQMIQQAQRESLAEQEKALQDEGEESFEPDDPQMYRDEAQTHYQQRKIFFQKAQEASNQGMKAVAAYYARLGNLHSVKFNEANQRACKKILEAVNSKRDANVLDLHLLHVTEALRATQAFLSERKRVLCASGLKQMRVSLITGRGSHSVDGKARLKPAVRDFLQKSHYSYYEANSGKFIVILKEPSV